MILNFRFSALRFGFSDQGSSISSAKSEQSYAERRFCWWPEWNPTTSTSSTTTANHQETEKWSGENNFSILKTFQPLSIWINSRKQKLIQIMMTNLLNDVIRILFFLSRLWIKFGYNSYKLISNGFTIFWFGTQSNLCTTTTLGTPTLWPLLTDDRFSDAGLCYKDSNWDSKLMVAIDRWSVFGGGR